MQTTLRLHSLPFDSARTYLAATVFILGNLIVPQLFHLVPQGGVTWLPIYFFTLVGAYKYGWRVGLLTALLSPVVNSLSRSNRCFWPDLRVLRPQGYAADSCCRRSGLSGCRNSWRMGHVGRLHLGLSGFPHRRSRNVDADIRRLAVHQPHPAPRLKKLGIFTILTAG